MQQAKAGLFAGFGQEKRVIRRRCDGFPLSKPKKKGDSISA
jgi:hypothetical protein